jgi:hypothetical protein
MGPGIGHLWSLHTGASDYAEFGRLFCYPVHYAEKKIMHIAFDALLGASNLNVV